jgi:hypothetical protein
MGGYTIASALAENIYSGDPVDLTGTGRDIALATAGDDQPIVGIFAGVKYVDANGEVQFRPRWITGTAATEVEALVYDDPFQEFIAQVDDTAGLAVGDVGLCAALVAGTGNNFTGRSAWQIDQSTILATVTLQVRILGLSRDPEAVYGQFANARCVIQRHRYGAQPSVGT